METDFDSKKLHPVISVKVFGVVIDWENAHDCSIESQSFKNNVLNKATQLHEFLKISSLLKEYCVRYRFVEADAWIEAFAISSNHELFEFDEKLKPIREELRCRINFYKKMIHEISSQDMLYQRSDAEPLNYAEYQSLKKLLTGASGSKMEIDFHGAGKEIIEISKSPYVEPNILDDSKAEEITGQIRYFDDVLGKVILYNLQDSSGFVVGYINLEANEDEHRDLILAAQAKRRRVKISFFPARNPLRPEKQAREGRIKEIVSVDIIAAARML